MYYVRLKLNLSFKLHQARSHMVLSLCINVTLSYICKARNYVSLKHPGHSDLLVIFLKFFMTCDLVFCTRINKISEGCWLLRPAIRLQTTLISIMGEQHCDKLTMQAS